MPVVSKSKRTKEKKRTSDKDKKKSRAKTKAKKPRVKCPAPNYKPNYQQWPKKMVVKGKKKRNPDAGCGPDMELYKGCCTRKFNEEDLGKMCAPRHYPKKSQILRDALTPLELEKLDAECARMHEQVMDEAQSMDAKDIIVYEALRELFLTAPAMFLKGILDKYFKPIGHIVSKVSPTFVDIRKRGSDITRRIPFGSFASRVSGLAKQAASKAKAFATYAVPAGFSVAKWLYNSPQAQRFVMHLAKLMKHGLCTVFAGLKDRKDMGWGGMAKEGFTHMKYSIMDAVEANSGIIATGIGTALGGVAGTLATPFSGPGGPALGLAVKASFTGFTKWTIDWAAKTGKLDDFLQTFTTGCKQFEYGLDEKSVAAYFLTAGIGSYGETLIKFFKALDIPKMMNMVMPV